MSPRRRLLALAAILALGLAWVVRTALILERHEYRTAHALAARGLSMERQSALIAGVLRASRFAFGSRTRDGRAGPLHLDAATARRFGLHADPALAGPYGAGPLRLLRARATEGDLERDARFDLDACLDVAVATIEARGPAYAAALPPPWREDETLGAVLAVSSLSLGADEVAAALDVLAGVLEGTDRDGSDPPSVSGPVARRALERALREHDGPSAETLDAVWRSWVSASLYRDMLPALQARSSPSAVEVFNAVKGVLIEATGAARWLLHLLLGGLIYVLVRSVLAERRMSPNRATALAFAAVAAIAVAVEVADAVEATATNKPQRPLGSVADLVVTCLLPAADRLRRSRG